MDTLKRKQLQDLRTQLNRLNSWRTNSNYNTEHDNYRDMIISTERAICCLEYEFKYSVYNEWDIIETSTHNEYIATNNNDLTSIRFKAYLTDNNGTYFKILSVYHYRGRTFTASRYFIKYISIIRECTYILLSNQKLEHKFDIKLHRTY